MPLGRVPLDMSAALLLAILPLAAAHGDEHEHSGTAMDMGSTHTNATSVATAAMASLTIPVNYFRHPQFAGWMYAHIASMTIAWAIILPAGKQSTSNTH